LKYILCSIIDCEILGKFDVTCLGTFAKIMGTANNEVCMGKNRFVSTSFIIKNSMLKQFVEVYGEI
jgi:hypothetical protein